jgi:hypothetical protein
VIGPAGVGVEVGNVVDEVGKVVGVVDDAGVCISSSPLALGIDSRDAMQLFSTFLSPLVANA